MLRPLDFLVLFKILAKGEESWGQIKIARELGMSPDSVNSALSRAAEAMLYSPKRKAVRRHALCEAATVGGRYFFAVKEGAVGRGMPTASGALPLVDVLIQIPHAVPVWPDPEGTVRGPTVQPLHPSAPRAARADERLYRLLALFDSVRIGDARERGLAIEALTKEINA